MLHRSSLIALLVTLVVALPTVASAQPSAEEQWIIYELNRIRSDPAAYGISAEPQPPLAISPRLSASARDKAQQMQDCGSADKCFSHNLNGMWPNRLAKEIHGYPLPAWWSLDANYIESLYAGGSLGDVLPTLLGSGSHRTHLLGETDFYAQHREIGVGRSSDGTRWTIHTAFRDSTSERLFVTGVVYSDANGNGRMDRSGEALAGVTVQLRQAGSVVRQTVSNSGGGYSLLVTTPGTYTIRASSSGFSQQEVTVSVGAHNVGVDFASPPVDGPRLWGSDRYATAVAVSQDTYPKPSQVSVVFVATGGSFPDALAGAAVAGKVKAPLLLTRPTSLPQVTRDELARLAPKDIYILGGPAAVSASVATALAEYGRVTRLSGEDRYATAAAISRHGFPTAGSATVVFVATGDDFADALASAPAATRLNGPVLLTAANSLPEVTRKEIIRLGPSQVIVLGGTAAISASVETALKGIAPDTIRLAGANRYATAVAVTKHAFPNSATPVNGLYMAVGNDFPDALAGAAAAAALGRPVLLTPPTSVPSAVRAEVIRLKPAVLIVLGGPSVFSYALQQAYLDLLD